MISKEVLQYAQLALSQELRSTELKQALVDKVVRNIRIKWSLTEKECEQLRKVLESN